MGRSGAAGVLPPSSAALAAVLPWKRQPAVGLDLTFRVVIRILPWKRGSWSRSVVTPTHILPSVTGGRFKHVLATDCRLGAGIRSNDRCQRFSSITPPPQVAVSLSICSASGGKFRWVPGGHLAACRKPLDRGRRFPRRNPGPVFTTRPRAPSRSRPGYVDRAQLGRRRCDAGAPGRKCLFVFRVGLAHR